MAQNFVEQATLKVKDQSTPTLRRINAELFKMHRQTKAINKIKFDVTNLRKAETEIQRITRSLAKIPKNKSIAVSVKPTVTQSSVNLMASDLRKKLKSQSFTAMVTPKSNIPASHTRLRVDTTGMQTALRQSWTELGFLIRNAVVDGFATGTTRLDVAETRLRLQNASPEERVLLNQMATETAERFPQVGRDAALALAVEALPTTQGDAAAAGGLVMETAELVQLQTALGISAEAALDGALKYIKAGEVMGNLTDEATGKIDPEKAKNYFDQIQRGAAFIGEEFGPNLVQQFVKYARSARYGMDDRALLTGFLLSEESGSTAAVGINQAITQLSGERIAKKQLANLVELGLITTERVAALEASGAEDFNLLEVVGGTAVNSDELRRNLLEWIDNNLTPALERAGIDTNDPNQVSQAAGQILGDRTAKDAVAGLIIRSDELNAQLDRMQALDVSGGAISDLAAQSLTAQLQAVESQFISVLGEIGNSMEVILLPALSATAGGLQNLAAFLAGPEGEGSFERSALTAAVVAAVGAGTVKLGTSISAKLSPFRASTVNLNNAAMNLNNAARLMGGTSTGALDAKGNRKGGRVRNPRQLAAEIAFGGAIIGSGTLSGEEDGIKRAIKEAFSDISEAIFDPTKALDFFASMGASTGNHLDPAVLEGIRELEAVDPKTGKTGRELLDLQIQYERERQATLAQIAELQRREEHFTGLITKLEGMAGEEGRSEAAVKDFNRQIEVNQGVLSGIQNELAELRPNLAPLAMPIEYTAAVEGMEQKLQERSEDIGEALMSGEENLGRAILEAMRQGSEETAQRLREVLDTTIGVAQPQAAPALGPRLDTGTSSPF